MISIKRYPIFKIENFLSIEENQTLFDYAITNENHFQNDEKIPDDKSKFIKNFPNEEYFISKLKCFASTVSESLWLKLLGMDRIETYLKTYINDSSFSINSASKNNDNRTLTFIYFFHKNPKSFIGGNLIIYDSIISKDRQPTSTFQEITPINNSLVFFPSLSFTEIIQVRVPSLLFEDGSFMIQGHIREFDPELIQPSLAIIES